MASSVAPTRPLAALVSRPRPGRLTAQRTASLRCNVAASAGKLISQSEIPAFLPRHDFMEQLQRWACMEIEANCVQNYGLPMKVDMEKKGGEGDSAQIPWGFTVQIQRDDVTLTSIRVSMDNENIEKFPFIGRGEDGMPAPQGDPEIIEGKNLQIWKIDDNTIDEETRTSIRGVCTGIMDAVNKYYSFGSVFSEEF